MNKKVYKDMTKKHSDDFYKLQDLAKEVEARPYELPSGAQNVGMDPNKYTTGLFGDSPPPDSGEPSQTTTAPLAVPFTQSSLEKALQKPKPKQLTEMYNVYATKDSEYPGDDDDEPEGEVLQGFPVVNSDEQPEFKSTPKVSRYGTSKASAKSKYGALTEAKNLYESEYQSDCKEAPPVAKKVEHASTAQVAEYEEMIRRKLKMVKTDDRTIVTAIVLDLVELNKNAYHTIRCEGEALEGYPYDRVKDTYEIRCAEILPLGTIPVAYRTCMENNSAWSVFVILPDDLIIRCMSPAQRKKLHEFRSKYPDTKRHVIQFVQAIDC